jgi:hypothetical protein
VLRVVPVAQLGWQLLTFNVPLPCPPVAAPHNVQLMAVTVVPPVAHPTVNLVGRTWGVEAGPQDSTAGTEATVDVVEGDVEEFPPCVVVVDTPLSVDLVVGEELEPTARPMAIPIPRAERTSATMPTRTYVLRLTEITKRLLSTTRTNGSSRRSRRTNGLPTAGRRHRGEIPSGESQHVTEQPLGLEYVSRGQSGNPDAGIRSWLTVQRGWFIRFAVSGQS